MLDSTLEYLMKLRCVHVNDVTWNIPTLQARNLRAHSGVWALQGHSVDFRRPSVDWLTIPKFDVVPS